MAAVPSGMTLAATATAPAPTTAPVHLELVPSGRLAPARPAAEPVPAERSVDDVSTAWRVLKRGFDIAFALTVLTLVSPVFAIVAAAIKLESRGPVFYRTRRVGYRGAPLMMLKFRKMRQDAAGLPLTARDDDRFTRVGAFLTAARLDELPQLWEVLRGRMSIVGPRPEDPQFVEMHADAYREILTVRPGMLGLSQLAYEAEKHIISADAPIEDYVGRIMPQKLVLDRLYARTTSAALDFSILFWATVALFLRRPVAVNRTTGEMNVRRRVGDRSVTSPSPSPLRGSGE